MRDSKYFRVVWVYNYRKIIKSDSNMKIVKIFLVSLAFIFNSLMAADRTMVDIETNYGTMTVELYPEKAPITVANFLQYVDANYYTDLIFHRIVTGIAFQIIQGGGFTENLSGKNTFAAIQNEADNGLSNSRGTIAMARTSEPHSATSQFYFNLIDNTAFDYTSATANGWGYTVFGEIIAGLDIMDAIAAVPTSTLSVSTGSSIVQIPDFPTSTVKILAVRRKEAQLNFTALQSEYQVGDNLVISLSESDISRSEKLDLWAGIAAPDGNFYYFTGNPQIPLSSTPAAFQSNVDVADTQHAIYSLNVPAGLTGTYTVYAIFNTVGSDLSQLSQTLRSNIATTQVIFK